MHSNGCYAFSAVPVSTSTVHSTETALVEMPQQLVQEQRANKDSMLKKKNAAGTIENHRHFRQSVSVVQILYMSGRSYCTSLGRSIGQR